MKSKFKFHFKPPFFYDDKTMLIKSSNGETVAKIDNNLYGTANMIVEALNYHAKFVQKNYLDKLNNQGEKMKDPCKVCKIERCYLLDSINCEKYEIFYYTQKRKKKNISTN